MLSGSPRETATAPPAELFSYLDQPSLVVAVSGGSDSTALLTLVHEARRAANNACRLVAVTVDHALRPESAGEARAVAGLAETLGIEHRTLVWQGAKPERGIQAAARMARQALLADVATELGAAVVLTGHTLDDQAETVLMRTARGDGIGLAGIAPATLFRNTIWFARPLLNQRRATLRDMLAAHGLRWMDDPSNENPDFERVRARKQLAGDPALFERTVAVAHEAAARRTRLAGEAAAVIDRHARLGPASTVEVDAHLLDAGDAAIHALRLMLAVVGSATHLPDEKRSAELLAALRVDPAGGSLANVRASRQDQTIVLAPDRRGRAGPPASMRSPYAELLPAFDYKAAAAIARLLGQPALPAMPWT